MTAMSAAHSDSDSRFVHFLKCHDWKAAWVAVTTVGILVAERIF